MLNINDLEKRWVEYKIRSFAPYAVTFLGFIFISSAAYFFIFSEDETKTKIHKDTPIKSPIQKEIPIKEETKVIKKEVDSISKTKEKSISLQKKKEVIEPIIIKELPKQKTIEKKRVEKKVIIQPSMRFLKDFENSYSYNEERKPKVKKREVKKMAPIALPTEEYLQTSKIKKAPTTKVKREEIITEEKKLKITIKRRESENDIKEVLARFQQNNNPALSLFAAKKYYELGNYKQAYNYALITNKINNDIEESWLIFAKALVKLGKKTQAIRTLQKYINYSHSSNAQILLDEIQRGKFQ